MERLSEKDELFEDEKSWVKRFVRQHCVTTVGRFDESGRHSWLEAAETHGRGAAFLR